MAASWQPDAGGMAQLLDCLDKLDMSNIDAVTRKEATERLDSFNQSVPDYCCYLAYVLCFHTQQDPRVRSLAGLILKNNLRELFARQLQGGQAGVVASQVLDYVKSALLDSNVLSDQIHLVRSAAGTVISTLTMTFGPESWPQAIEKLIALTESPDSNAIYGAFQALSKVCEDVPRKLEQMTINNFRVLDIILPRIINTLKTTADPKIRNMALKCLNPFVHTAATGALKPHVEEFVQALFRCASDRDPEVRKNVCSALTALVPAAPAVLMPELSATVDFMLYSTQDEDEEVALEACEFWLAFAEDQRLRDALAPHLSKILPVLLKGMVYSANELLTLDVDEDDAAVPDREQDIKPRFYGGRSDQHVGQEQQVNGNGIGEGGSKGRADNLTNGTAATAGDDSDEDDDEDEEDDLDEDDEIYEEWNLRKCSAAALDVIAVGYGDRLLEMLLPHLKEFLFDPDWTHREAGILALGAIAEGCIGGMEPHLPLLVPMMLQALADRKALVRSIACWTLGRYATWIINSTVTPEQKSTIFLPTLEALLERVVDSNKRVQEAACSAFATLEEEAGEELEPYLDPILHGLVRAFHKYQQKNLLILYDALGTLADAVGNGLAKPELLNILMPPLIDRWQALTDFDKDLIPLLECIASIAIAIGNHFIPYVQPVFERCLRIIQQSLQEFTIFVQDQDHYEAPDKTFLIVALDLLSALTQGLAQEIIPLYQASPVQVFPLLSQCLNGQFPEPAVRQSAFALVGDCAISCFPILRPHLSEYLPQIVAQIDAEGQAGLTSVCNNAAWAAGEIAVKAGPDMGEWVDPLMRRLVPVLTSPTTVRSLRENSAVTIGRLALACPDLIAPSLGAFMKPWCSALADIKDNEEKDSAFKGICLAIERNPSGLTDCFPHWLNAVGKWQRPSPALSQSFRSLLATFKAGIGPAAWDAAVREQHPLVAQRLAAYGV